MIKIEQIENNLILGTPVETEIGECNCVLLKDYDKFKYDFYIFQADFRKVLEILEDSNVITRDELLMMKDWSLYEIALNNQDVLLSYMRIFTHVFNFEIEDVLEKITEDNFMIYRDLVMKMNCLNETNGTLNDELREWEKDEQEFYATQGDGLSLTDIIAHVAIHVGGYNGMKDWNLYQLYMAFHSIGNLNNHKATTLFATVSSEVNVENWCKHVDLFKKKELLNQKAMNKFVNELKS